jgi:hypothetical protein
MKNKKVTSSANKPIRNHKENLSASVLFTFTPKIEYLLEMLQKGITPRYAYERLPGGEKGYIAPMKCFCDIPLSKVKFHMERYGYFGIGLKKSFLRKQGATPVIYVHSKSSILKDIIKRKPTPMQSSSILPLLKRYDGDDYRFDRDNKLSSKKRVYFYDEQEWRYLPPGFSCELSATFKNIKLGVQAAGKINFENTYIKNCIEIPPTAIEYIIINKNRELDSLIEALKQIYKKPDVDTILTKVQISDKILRDF